MFTQRTGALRRLSKHLGTRLESTGPGRPHPLSPPGSRPGASGANKSAGPHTQQYRRLPVLPMIMIATFVGSTTYVLGYRSGETSSSASASSSVATKHVSKSDFDKALSELKQQLGDEDTIATDRASLESHGTNEWSHLSPQSLPGAVIYPRSTEDVVKIVKIASKYRVPLVPYSGGTSLEGHLFAPDNPRETSKLPSKTKFGNSQGTAVEELPVGHAWTIDFSENMNQVIAVHADDHDAVVQPGLSYDALNMELKEKGIPLFFPVDPAPGAQFGGLCGTGASGTNAVRYGTMRENVLNMTVVLPNGEVIKTRQRAKKSSAGPDLGRLFIGSEGTLGIITEITVKLAPVLPTRVAVASFPSIELAAKTARDIMQHGIGIACVEMLDDVMMKAVNKKEGMSWPEKPTLFFKFTGSSESGMKGDIERTRQISQENQGSKFTFAKTTEEAEKLWYARKVALYSALDWRPGSKCWVTDVCVPMQHFPTIVKEIKEDVERNGIEGPLVAHAGDSNMHFLLLYANDDEYERVRGIVTRMVKRAQALDGTMTGEHSVGQGKKAYLANELGEPTVELLRRIKQMIDPRNIMNPGKLIPDRP